MQFFRKLQGNFRRLVSNDEVGIVSITSVDWLPASYDLEVGDSF